MDRINIIQRMPDVDIHSAKDMKELIDKIFQAIDVARFPPDKQECPVRVIFWLSGQPTSIWLLTQASKNQELIDYFEAKSAEMVKVLTDADDKEDAKKYKPLLKELRQLMLQPQKQKKPFWKHLFGGD
jgi:hypothetical protein